jgi:hypothetical protein
VNQTHNGPVTFRILSETRGRLRLRVLGTVRFRRRAVQRVAQILSERNDVLDVHANPATGSVTLVYRQDAEAPNFTALLAEAGLGAEEPAAEKTKLEPAGMSDTATTILDAVTQLDARLSRSMQRRLDLKSAVPLALLGLAAWKIATEGIGWKQLTGATLLWYAYTAFKDLDVPRSSLGGE